MTKLFIIGQSDLTKELNKSGVCFFSADSLLAAIDSASFSDAIIVQSAGYPSLNSAESLSEDLLSMATAKKLRILLEYPAEVVNVKFSKPRRAKYERTLVTGDLFSSNLPVNTILMQHQCWFMPAVDTGEVLLGAGKVAGYRKAVFGLPDKCDPILFRHPDNPDILLAATSLTQFIKGRFSPASDWKLIWERLLDFLTGRQIKLQEWNMTVRPSFKTDSPLPAGVEYKALRRNQRWFNDNMFFSVDGKYGVFEGAESGIAYNGKQFVRPKSRADCNAEASMIPAGIWLDNANPEDRELACNILKYLFEAPELIDLDSKSPTYGLLKFYENIPVYYGDDNARAVLACLFSTRQIDTQLYDKRILRCLLSLIRCTGPNGFRHNFLRTPGSFADGKTWEDYGNEELFEGSPHHQAYLWAAFILGYKLSGHKEFLEKAKKGLKIMMSSYPDIPWTNGLAEEKARLLLPLAFLVRIDSDPQYSAWLDRVAEDVICQMHSSGGIIEELGRYETGRYPAPQDNDNYGVTEAPLIQENGDLCCDLLYTMNYAFLGMHEAAAATGNPEYHQAADKMADFLCRIQTTSLNMPLLDGCWLRGFDFDLWDYYGSSADIGWGAWSVETGWTNTWIATVFCMRQHNFSLYDCAEKNRYKEFYPAVLAEMSVVHHYDALPVENISSAPGAEN